MIKLIIKTILITNALLFSTGLLAISKLKENYNEQKPSSIYKIQKDGSRKQFRPGIDDLEMFPSWKVCRTSSSPDYYESTDTWQFGCADCQIKFELLAGTENGGHNTSGTGSDNHSGIRPLGLIQGVDLGEWYPLEGYGTIGYEASDYAGEVILRATIQHFTPLPNEVHDINIYVNVPDLVDAGGYNIFTTNNITSHLQDNRHLSQDSLDSFIGALINWRNELTTGGMNNNDIPVPNSEGLSLKYGGLFDVAKNFTTSGGHCNHRKGTDIDIGMSNVKILSEPNKTLILTELEDSMLLYDYVFPVASEGPDATSTEWNQSGFHWHAKYTL